jgi:hypothetical protein
MVTDSKGRFVFQNLQPADDYFLDARRFGYAPTRYGWSGPGQSLALADIARITLSQNQWIDGIDIPLWRLGVISGRVVDERGEPVVGVAVRAFSTRRIAGNSYPVGGPIVTTDDRGVYRMTGLDRGRYVVAVLSVQSTALATTADAPLVRPVGALATGGIGASRGTTVSAPGVDVDGRHRLVITNFATPPPPATERARAYAAAFYPAARTADQAIPIDIDYGDSRAGVDFQLVPAAAVRVSGRVAGASSPPPRLLLRLMPAGGETLGFGSEAATTQVDRDGTFTFLNVPEGQYTLAAQASVTDFTSGSTSIRLPDAPGFPGGGISVGSVDGAPDLGYLARNGALAAYWARQSVSVGSADVDDVVVTLRPTVSVRGRIALAEGTEAAPNGRLELTAEPADGDPSLGQFRGRAESDASRSFVIDGLLGGTYLLTSSKGIVSLMWNGRDLRETGFDASAGHDFDDVLVTLTDRTARVSGTVHGVPQGTAAVLVFPVERERWVNYGWRPRRIGSARVGPGGAFQIDRLPRGDYFLVAVNAGHVNAWSDSAFLALVAGRATRVSLDWGESLQQDLTYTEVTAR